MYLYVEQALSVWSESDDQQSPPPPVDKRQKAWDGPVVHESYDSLLDNAPDARSWARLLALATKESGAWLHALPISAVGLRIGWVISSLEYHICSNLMDSKK